MSRRLRLAKGSWKRSCHFRVRFSLLQWVAAPFPSHFVTWASLIERRTLALAMHRPDLAAHVDQMKSAPRQFAHGDDIAAMHRRPSIWRRVLDLMTVSHVEMLHQCLRVGCRQPRPPLTRDSANSRLCCTAQIHAAMHNTQAPGSEPSPLPLPLRTPSSSSTHASMSWLPVSGRARPMQVKANKRA